jgi:DNA polymerase-3 subunit beta
MEDAEQMKLTIAKETLAAGLAKVAGIVEKKTTIPLLSNIKIEATPDALTLTGTDLDIEAKTRLDADIEREGVTTVSADILANLVKRFKAGSLVTLDYDGARLNVSSGKSRVDFATLSADEYPSLSDVEDGVTFTAPASDLARMFGKTAFAVSNEETRYYLNGVYFHPGDDGLTAVATDGHRVAVAWSDTKVDFPGVIVPRKAVAELRKVLDIGDVAVTVTDRKIRFDLGDTVITSKVIDYTYPDYRRVIPQGLPDTFRADAKALAGASSLVAMVSEEKVRAVTVDVSSGAVRLSSGGQHHAEDEVEADVTGGGAVMGFNSKYLADVLAQADGGDVDAAYDAKNVQSPIVITATEDAQFLAVVMPMRV